MPELFRGTGPKTPQTSPSGILTFASLLIVFILLVSAEPLAAQERNARSVEKLPLHGSILSDSLLFANADGGLRELYNMRFRTADSVFSGIATAYPEHPIGPFLKGLLVWWRILPELSTGDTIHDQEFMGLMAEVIDWSDRRLKEDENDFDAMFFKGAALGFRGRLRSNRREWLSAAADGRKTLDYIFRIAAADTTNADFQFGKGVYDYFAAVIPEKYPIVRPMMFFFPDADRDRGIRELEFTATKGRFIQTEAVYFLLQIYLFYEPDFEKSRQYVTWLRERYPDNAFFQVLEGRVFVRWSDWARAAALFRDVIEGYSQEKPGYSRALAVQSYYYSGRYEMMGGHFPEALKAFHRVEQLTEPDPVDSYYGVHAQLRMGMVYDLLGRRSEAEARYRRVLKMTDLSDSRDRARRYLSSPYQRP